MSNFLAIKKVFDLSASNDTQMLVSRQSRELSASSNDVVTTMKKHFDYTVDVTFDSAGGTACASSTYVLGQTYQELPTTERSSYIFQGWYTQLTGGIQISAESTVELSTTTLYAQWKYVDVGDDYTEYVVQTTSSYKKTGIYSASRYSSASAVVVDWGDGNVEAIEGNISQLVHEYSSVGVFHVKISNISNFAASANDSTWYGTTSQNRYTFKDIVKTGSKCTTMPNAAFYYCAALSSISFLSSCFTSLTTVPPSAFYYCSSITTNLSSLPARIKTLGGSAFRYCTGLTGIQDLRNTGLTSLTGTYTFADCTGVKEFKLPSNIGTQAGTYLFYSDSGLSALEIPSSLTAIPNSMAQNCTGLKDITVPSNIKSINAYSFRGCTNLSSVTYETSALTAIGTYAFYQNYALSDLNVPDTVKSIGSRAFYNCYSTYASALALPSSLTSLGTYAYQYCYNLKMLEIPSSLTAIGNTAFSGCRSLSSITDYRLTAQTVGANTFGSATGTSNTAYTGYNTRGSNKLRIYSAASGYDAGYWLDPLQNANKCGFNIEYIDQQANDKLCVIVETTDYYKKTGIYSAQRDDTSKPIVIDWGDGTVEQVNGDVSQKVHTYSASEPEVYIVTVQNIKSYAASTGDTTWYIDTSQNNQTLREVSKMPESVLSIGDYSFHGCGCLTSVAIPDGVTSIGTQAFLDCALNNVVIPSSVSSIDFDSFAYYALGGGTLMTFVGKTMSQVQSMNGYSFGIAFGSFGDIGSTTISCSDGSFTIAVECFLKGTEIAMSDGTTKKVEDIDYSDSLKVWDFDNGCLSSAPVCWLTRPGLKNDHYYQLGFSDGTVLRTTGQNSNHKIYDVDKCRFEGVRDVQVGDRIYSLNGVVSVTDKQYIESEVEYYNLMTSGTINCFAEGILASNRYSNIYPVDGSMKYIKDGRQIRPYSEFEEVGISRYFYDNLRLGEIDPAQEPMSKTIQYINKIKSVMRPLPENN